jgi:hypothetical protein
MTRIALVGLALALISACGTIVKDDGGPHNGSDTGPGPDGGTDPGPDGGTGPGSGSSVSPRAGVWTYGELTPVSSTCSAVTPHGEAGDFAIDHLLPASFRIAPADGTAPFVCTWNTVGFSCPARASFVVDNRPGVDAVITGHATATGRFSDGDHGAGRQNARIDCTGAQCAVIGPFPCDVAVDFAIHTR